MIIIPVLSLIKMPSWPMNNLVWPRNPVEKTECPVLRIIAPWIMKPRTGSVKTMAARYCGSIPLRLIFFMINRVWKKKIRAEM